MMNKKELWNRLKKYRFENLVPPEMLDKIKHLFGGTDPSTCAFASKIASKRGWTKQFALRAVEEYKKFVYLGVISKFSVTPSQAIDYVWHQHILFTHGYWDFCKNVIQYPFNHSPELVPMSEQTSLFSAQYNATLELYRQEFGVDPPAEIWGTPKFNLAAVTAASRKRDQTRAKSLYATDAQREPGLIEEVGYTVAEVVEEISIDGPPLHRLFQSETNEEREVYPEFNPQEPSESVPEYSGPLEAAAPVHSHAPESCFSHSHVDTPSASVSYDTSSHGVSSGSSVSSCSSSGSSCGSSCGGGGGD